MQAYLGVIIGAVIVIVVEVIRVKATLKVQREQMNETRVLKKEEEKETHRRDAANAALEIMKMAGNKDEERKHLVKHYEMAYVEMLEILRAPEK